MRLLDVTWDSGRFEESGRWRREYGTDYLFLEPAAFIHTHFPVEPADQLLDPPLSFREFEALPWLRGRFFRYGLGLRTEGMGGVVKADGAFRLDLSCPADVLLDGHVAHARVNGRAGAPVEGSAFVRRGRGAAAVVFAVPRSGSWRAHLFARPRESRRAAFESVLTFRIDSTRGAGAPGAAGNPPFPLLYAGYDATGCELLGPLAGVLRRGSSEEFRLRAPGAAGVAIRDGKRMIELRKGRGGVYTLSCPVPAVAELKLFARLAAGRYTGLLRYRVG